MNNFSRVLHDSTGDSLYAKSLVPNDVETALRSARDEAREAIRDHFGSGAAAQLSESMRKSDLILDSQTVETASALNKPKFRMQGSFSYDTQVNPETMPPQEIDIDDGMFLPVSFISETGPADPSVAADFVFTITEIALAPLCEKRGWELVTTKNSCVRIKLPNHAHLDIAIYAVPDKEFVELMEKANQATDTYDTRMFDEASYREISRKEIRLATRNEGWIPSDPRLLEDWFIEMVRKHGVHIRVASRLLKIWRNASGNIDRLASIALMHSVVRSCEDGAFLEDDRYDLLLARIAEELPVILSNRIPNPCVDNAYLDQGWTDAERASFVKQSELLSAALNLCLYETLSAEDIIAEISKAFGKRTPDDVDRVVVRAPETKSGATPIYATPATAKLIDKAASERQELGLGTRPYHE